MRRYDRRRTLALTDEGAKALNDAQHSRILVVDSSNELDVAAGALRSDGRQVVETDSLDRAISQLRSVAIHAIVIDPFNIEPGGLDAVVDLRRSTNVPVLVITNLTDRTVLVAALRLGVDDYVLKPVWPAEIAARVAALVRRTKRGDQLSRIDAGHLIIDVASRQAFVAGKAVSLKNHEFDLLAMLAQHAGTVFARDEIFDRVWHERYDEKSAAIVVEHIRRLRRAVESDPRNPRLIQTVQRRGYRFNLSALGAS
jgi:DNA-binding response OmpR family regulator